MTATPAIHRFGKDTTVRLSLRHGDYLLWVATDSVLDADRESAWTIREFWELRDGDFVTMTNRWSDVPAWFELQPAEVAGRAVSEMQKKLDAGFKPRQPLEGPCLWRVKAGDRLAWVSTTGPRSGVREIYDFRSCALVLGENTADGTNPFLFFGAPQGADPSPAVKAAMRSGFDAAWMLGMPRVLSEEWFFGD